MEDMEDIKHQLAPAKVEPGEEGDDVEMKTAAAQLTDMQVVEIEGAHLLEGGHILISDSDGMLTLRTEGDDG